MKMRGRWRDAEEDDGDNDDIYMLFIYIVLNNYSICWLKYLFLVPSLSVSFSTTYILSFVLFLILYFWQFSFSFCFLPLHVDLFAHSHQIQLQNLFPDLSLCFFTLFSISFSLCCTSRSSRSQYYSQLIRHPLQLYCSS